MKTKCPKCKGIGSVVVDYKECEACGGTGFEEDAFDASTIISQIFFGAVYVLLDKNKKEIVGIAALNRC